MIKRFSFLFFVVLFFSFLSFGGKVFAAEDILISVHHETEYYYDNPYVYQTTYNDTLVNRYTETLNCEEYTLLYEDRIETWERCYHRDIETFETRQTNLYKQVVYSQDITYKTFLKEDGTYYTTTETSPITFSHYKYFEESYIVNVYKEYGPMYNTSKFLYSEDNDGYTDQ